MARVWINPRYEEVLSRCGLTSAADFTRQDGVIVCGHPDRHVRRVELAPGLAGFLKLEHRVPWKDRFVNAWAGFGLVATSTREARILQELALSGIPCPEVLAYGEDEGRAFVLLREEPGMTDVRVLLQKQTSTERRRLAEALGQELARIHEAGFDHPDLVAKHVLAGAGTSGSLVPGKETHNLALWGQARPPVLREAQPRFCFLDWQRARRRRQVGWRVRCRDLALLDATLAQSLASDRERLACLRCYWGAGCQPAGVMVYRAGRLATCPTLSARFIRGLSLELQKKPRIRELQRLPLPAGEQTLVWLDGESLCVTREFREELGGRFPDWLRFPKSPAAVERLQVPRAGERSGNLIRRCVSGLGNWLRSWQGHYPAPEVEQAAVLFRLERHGIPSPRLLAFGHHKPRPWRTESFILSEAPRVEGTLVEFLARCSRRQRSELCRQAGGLLRRLHEAGYAFEQPVDLAQAWGVHVDADGNADIVLTSIDGLGRSKQSRQRLELLDLSNLWKAARATTNRSDAVRFFLGYLDLPRLTGEVRALVRRIIGAAPKVAPRDRQVAA